MFHQIAVKMTHIIVKRGELQGVNKSKIRYGIEIFLTGLAKIFFILITSLILGLFSEMLFLMATFITLRLFSGGLHLSKYYRCVLLGLVLFLGLAFLAKWVSSSINELFLMILIYMITILAFISCWKYAPALFTYRKFSMEKKERLRKLSFIYLVLWCSTMSVLTLYIPKELVLSSVMGIALQIWSIYPISYKFMQKIEGRKEVPLC